MNPSPDPLRAAIDASDLPALVAHYYPDSGAAPGRRGAVFAVWRGDRHKSFSLFVSRSGSWLWRDHATGESGNSFAFLTEIAGFSRAAAAAMLVENRLSFSSGPSRDVVNSTLPERPQGAPPLEDGLTRALNQGRIKPFAHPLSRVLLSQSASEMCVREALEQPRGKDARRIIETAYQALKAAGRKRVEHGRIKETYEYQDERGKPLFEVVRFEPKSFSQRRKAPDGSWIWGLSAGGYRENKSGNWVLADPGEEIETTFEDTRLVLYHLPQLIRGIERGERVFVVEGEKDALRVESLELVSTTNPGGALKWFGEDGEAWGESYSETLRGADVVILHDNDAAGFEHARRVGASLSGVANTWLSLNLPDQVRKGDISNWLDAGRGRQDLLDLVEAVS